jgi:hypothetical protein
MVKKQLLYGFWQKQASYGICIDMPAGRQCCVGRGTAQEAYLKRSTYIRGY